jgi:hypothetical protein
MDYIIVPTSNSDYQSWQCRLLNWSRKKVNQNGKLIFLRCLDEMGEHRPFDVYTDKDVTVIDLPDYALEWENTEEHAKRGEKHWWGAIPNKYMSIKWLCDNNYFKDDDTLLFLDPDMIFLEPITYQPKDDEIIAQRFIHYYPLNNWTVDESDRYGWGIMYPFCINFKTLKKIIQDYKEASEGIRRQTKRWEAEMWGLDYAVKKNKLHINYVEDFGYCTAWKNVGDTDVSKLIHFPNEILDISKSYLWFKQAYTMDRNMNIPLQSAKNVIDKLLLTNVSQERTDFLYHLKWDTSDILKFYDGSAGYIVLRPWPGGFNNIRMSLELAVCIAYLTNKVLVLPPKYKMYLLRDEFGLEDFFDINDLGIDVMSFEEFCSIKQIEPSFGNISTIASKVMDYEVPRYVLNFEKVKPNTDFTKNREVLNKEDFMGDGDCIFFDGTLLGNFYQTIHTSRQNELKRLIGRHVHYKTEITDMAWQTINWLGDQQYYAIHIRRNDFQYKHLFISAEEIFNNIKDTIPIGSRLYIATDETNRQFFEPLARHYKLYFYDEVAKATKINPHYNYIPIIEQLICTRAIKFIGNDYSTLSSYAYRMRGYMNDVLDKNFYINTKPYDELDQLDFLHHEKYVANWSREYKDSWNFENKTIFVSIAAYHDKQLIPTLKDLYNTVHNLDRITVGVHLQHDDEHHQLLLNENFPNIKIIYTPKEDSKGVVWARELIKDKLYTNEDYFFQIDAHSRFRPNWDNILINQLETCRFHNTKTLLSTYPNHFDLSETNQEYITKIPTNAPLVIKQFLSSENEKDNRLDPRNLGAMSDYEIVDNKWIAGGFIFAPSDWLKEIQVPNQIVSKGEEDVQLFLSYLNGWDVKLTSEAVVWHNYNAADLDGSAYRRPNLNKLQDNSINVINKILEENNYTRSVQQLEEYLGVTFRLKPKTIFVNIASFRDDQLVRTINSCLSQAKYPENIRIGLCWQYDETEDTTVFDNDPRIKIHKVFWKDVEGSVCWARHLVQDKFFNDEDFYMQVDSHTIFAKDWDEMLMGMYSELPNPKSIISIGPPYYYDMTAVAALPPLDGEVVEERDGILYDAQVKKQKIDNINPHSSYFTYGFLPADNLEKPIPSRHISAAIVFAPGFWVREVPYDPNLYFHGEESTLAMRSWTRGWDLFNPNKFVAWHLKYYFPDRLRHWNTFDQNIINDMAQKSVERHHRILRNIDGGKDLGIYGLGNERSIKEWEIYSGVSYLHGIAHPSVYKGITPNPITITESWEWWEEYKHDERIKFDIESNSRKLKILVWAFEETQDIAREKAKYLLDTASKYNIEVEFIGIGQVFNPRNTRERLILLQQQLRTLYNSEDIVLVMDGYDTLFNNTPTVALTNFIKKDTRVLISAEQIFTYQYSQFQEKYEKINSPYKYVNAGTYMGYANSLISMIDELLEIPAPFDSNIDQGLLGVWVHNNIENTYKVQMDTNCDVFWVTCKDWQLLGDLARGSNSVLVNPKTNTQAFIIHNAGNGAPEHYRSYEQAYLAIMGKQNV